MIAVLKLAVVVKSWVFIYLKNGHHFLLSLY